MFKCYLRDVNALKMFLRLNDTDYVDVLLNKGTSLFISNSPSLFGCYSIITETTAVFEPIELRMPVKILKNLACEGSFYVEKVDDNVKVSFYDKQDTKVATATFIYQTIFTDSYKHKLSLLTNVGAYGKAIEMHELYKLCKVSKTSNGIITVGKGVVGSSLSSRGKVFYVPAGTLLKQQHFSITASSMLLILSLSSSVHSIENFLCASKNGLTILATKCRGDSNDEYELMELAKAKYRCEVDIERVVNFVKNTKLDVNAISLDISQKVCKFEETHLNYEIPFAVTNLEKSPNAELDPITIPMSIINEMNSGLEMKFKIEKKKNFSKISKDNMFIYF